MKPIYVIGAGGTTSYLLPLLITQLRDTEFPPAVVLIDGDTVTATNLQRQHFLPQHVGRNKAEALATMYRDLHPNLQAIPNFYHPDTIPLPPNVDLFLCVDNYAARALAASAFAAIDGGICVNAGNETDSASVQIWVRANGTDLTPPITFMHPEIAYDPADDRASMSCATLAALPGGGQTPIANALAAALAVHAWCLAQTNPPWTELHLDLRRSELLPTDLRLSTAWSTPSPAR